MGLFDRLRQVLDEAEKDVGEFSQVADELWTSARVEFKKMSDELKPVMDELKNSLTPDVPETKTCPHCGKPMAFTSTKEIDSKAVVTVSSKFECGPCGYRLDRVTTTRGA